MPDQYPYPRSQAVMSVGLSILLTIITCGIYGLYWQYRQIGALNGWLGRKELSFGLWLLLSIITCGIFAVYYEYKMAQAIVEVQETHNLRVQSDLTLICLLLSLFGLGIVSIAIQQAEINKFYGASLDF